MRSDSTKTHRDISHRGTDRKACRLADLPTDRWPFISVVVPIRNEGSRLAEVLDTILNQDYPRERLEILCVDGDSDDDSAAVIDGLRREFPHLRRLSNPDRIAPCGFNVGIRAAKGDYVAILGAHAQYAPNYLSASMDAILETGADMAGGLLRTVPGGTGVVALSIGHVLTHRFGVGGSEFRVDEETPGKWVGGIPFPLFNAGVFRRIGLYDPRLVRNQDNDLHVRLERAGGRAFRSGATWCSYRARSTLSRLIRYAYDYGQYHVPLVRVNRFAFRFFYFVPFLFVGAIVACLALGAAGWWRPLSAVTILYAAANLLSSLHIVLTRPGVWRCAAILPIVFAAFHLSYGAGTWAGLFRFGLSSRFRAPSGKRPGDFAEPLGLSRDDGQA